VLGDRWPAQLELVGQVAGRPGAFDEQPQQPAPDRVRQG
jgi:hypothetical protein